MEVAIYVEQICGVFLLIMGLSLLRRKEYWQRVVQDFRQSPGLVYLGGLFSLLIGLGLVWTHNIWELNSGLVVTLLGWASLIKGAFLIVLPEAWLKLVPEKSEKLFSILKIEGGILEVLGLLVLWGAVAAV